MSDKELRIYVRVGLLITALAIINLAFGVPKWDERKDRVWERCYDKGGLPITDWTGKLKDCKI
jgi:hypothetical protein